MRANDESWMAASRINKRQIQIHQIYTLIILNLSVHVYNCEKKKKKIIQNKKEFHMNKH